MATFRTFPAKLLLFGEHVLLLGAPALAVPVASFQGGFVWANAALNTRLIQFAQSEALRSVDKLDAERFEAELRRGLFFQSDIPSGYGLGSSGALCAAVYDRYAGEKTGDLAQLKQVFAQMESFFHGSSSGIDPLTSFTGAPILIAQKTEVHIAEPRSWNLTEKPAVFLLDSELPRRTGPLVNWFLEKSREADFAKKLAEAYLPAHEAMLSAWLAADTAGFWSNLQRVSRFQFENFEPMVPQTVHDFWASQFQNPDLALKICGAGGGGFVLGFARTKSALERLALPFRILWV